MEQYFTIAAQSQMYACWDPRLGKWMSVAAKGKSNAKEVALSELPAKGR